MGHTPVAQILKSPTLNSKNHKPYEDPSLNPQAPQPQSPSTHTLTTPTFLLGKVEHLKCLLPGAPVGASAGGSIVGDKARVVES